MYIDLEIDGFIWKAEQQCLPGSAGLCSVIEKALFPLQEQKMGVLICDLSVDSEALGKCLHLSGYDIASIKLTPKIASINLPD